MSIPSGSVVIITGTSRGLGLQLAQMFISSGNKVFGCSRGAPVLDDDLYSHSCLDLCDEEQVRRWIRVIRKDAGRIDLLVCNAGNVASVLPLTMTSSDIVESYLHTSIAGTFYVCREAGKVMTLQRSGRIVAISSIMTRLRVSGTAAYSASKSAIEQMVRVMATELAEANVTCNTIAPGLMLTEASASFGAEWRERMLTLQTIRRAVTSEEIFHAISYFASPQAAIVTGQTLYMGLVN